MFLLQKIMLYHPSHWNNLLSDLWLAHHSDSVENAPKTLHCDFLKEWAGLKDESYMYGLLVGREWRYAIGASHFVLCNLEGKVLLYTEMVEETAFFKHVYKWGKGSLGFNSHQQRRKGTSHTLQFMGTCESWRAVMMSSRPEPEPEAARAKHVPHQLTCPKSMHKAASMWQAGANHSLTPDNEEMASPSMLLPLGKDATTLELEVSMSITFSSLWLTISRAEVTINSELNTSSAMSSQTGLMATMLNCRVSRQANEVSLKYYCECMLLTLFTDIIKAIFQAPESKSPSQEDLMAIIILVDHMYFI